MILDQDEVGRRLFAIPLDRLREAAAMEGDLAANGSPVLGGAADDRPEVVVLHEGVDADPRQHDPRFRHGSGIGGIVACRLP